MFFPSPLFLRRGPPPAVGQQYRFAAADYGRGPNKKPKAVFPTCSPGGGRGWFSPGPALSYFRTGPLFPGRRFMPGSFPCPCPGVGASGGYSFLAQDAPAPGRRAKARGAWRARSYFAIIRSPDVFCPPSFAGNGELRADEFSSWSPPRWAMVLFVRAHTNEGREPSPFSGHIVAMFRTELHHRLHCGTDRRPPWTAGARAVSSFSAVPWWRSNGITTWHFDLALVLFGRGVEFSVSSARTAASGAKATSPRMLRGVQALNEQLVFGMIGARVPFGSGFMLQRPRLAGDQTFLAIPVCHRRHRASGLGVDWRGAGGLAAGERERGNSVGVFHFESQYLEQVSGRLFATLRTECGKSGTSAK